MDVFKFLNPNSPTKMEQGELITGLTSKTWIERYGKEGEFTFVAPVDSGMRDILPIGTFISHVDTTDIMIVENHAISDDSSGNQGVITITGRGYETFFESRIIGSNRNFPVSEFIVDYSLLADWSWNQTILLINDHTSETLLIDPGNTIPYMTALSLVGSYSGDPSSIARTMKRDTLYAGVLLMLAVDGLGIKVSRPGPASPLGAASQDVCVGIHFGTDRSDTITFSYAAGQILSADYLWSNKTLRNAALLTGTYVEVVVIPPDTGYARRMMYIDASSVDSVYSGPPVDSDLTAAITEMTILGTEALSSQNNVTLVSAVAAPGISTYIFRKDFDVGDIVTVVGDYDATAKMRITEYVEIEDATGFSGYPTLALV